MLQDSEKAVLCFFLIIFIRTPRLLWYWIASKIILEICNMKNDVDSILINIIKEMKVDFSCFLWFSEELDLTRIRKINWTQSMKIDLHRSACRKSLVFEALWSRHVILRFSNKSLGLYFCFRQGKMHQIFI